MSFSSDIKNGLCNVSDFGKQEAAAMLYGLFYAGRTLDGKPAIQTENAELIAAARLLCEVVFPNEKYEVKRLVKNGNSLYTFRVKSVALRELFGDFSSINYDVVSGNDSDSGAFLRGIFVSCGSVTDPNKEYHLEMILPENCRTEQLRAFLDEHGMAAKVTERLKNSVLYFKTSELIEDFLTYIGAGSHALEIMQVKIEKDIRNRANRCVNCDSANLDKTVAASEKSRRDIETIYELLGEENLTPELRETARLRIENPESSLSELCGLHTTEISRSGLNHRLKKLSKIAEELRSGNN